MRNLFINLSNFFKRKGYLPDQADQPVFDEMTSNEAAQPSAASTPAKEFNLAEELKKAKAEIAEVDKAFKELSNHQVL